jgi:glutaredoxin
MEYLLFTLPNCPKCDAMKAYLKETSLEVQEFDLVKKGDRMKIREYLKVSGCGGGYLCSKHS